MGHENCNTFLLGLGGVKAHEGSKPYNRALALHEPISHQLKIPFVYQYL